MLCCGGPVWAWRRSLSCSGLSGGFGVGRQLGWFGCLWAGPGGVVLALQAPCHGMINRRVMAWSGRGQGLIKAWAVRRGFRLGRGPALQSLREWLYAGIMQTRAIPKAGLNFRKMHGLGNDFVILDSRGMAPVCTPALARAIGDRHRGVGFDQLAEIRDGEGTDICLDFWNSDGSRAGACGNATRCVAGMVMAETDSAAISIRTVRGILHGRVDAGVVSVNMGAPQLDWREIPLSHAVDPQHLPLDGDPVAVGMGNPHAVFFVDDIATVDVATRGVAVEHDPLFPERTNVEFAEIRARDDIRMRVWERGTGITLACGSGACATLVAAHQRGLTGACVRMELDGGWLTLDWRDDGVWMAGPTAHVFDGVFTPVFLADI